MTEDKKESQSRFLIAAALSMAVLLGWSYFFAPKPDPNKANANVAQNTSPANTADNTAQQTAQQPTPAPVAQTPDNNPQKTLTIKTPLYEVRLDSKGAAATSWILLKNVSSHGERPLYADGATNGSGSPLQLISPEALAQEPRAIPFKLATGDPNLDAQVNERNYQISIAEDVVELKGTDSKQVDFTLKADNGIEIVKSFTFYADSNLNDLKITAKRDGQTIPNTKLLIGAGVGDQGIKFHNVYHVEPEGVGYVNGSVDRHYATSLFKEAKDTTGKIVVNGTVDWAGVGDTYFGMAAIPAQAVDGVEYHAFKKDIPSEPYYGGIWNWITRNQQTKITRHLVTALVPVAADGSVTKIYTGSKDYFTLADYDAKLSAETGRDIHLHDFINFSSYSWIRWIVKPIAITLVKVLSFIDKFFGNYGISIIIFTLIFYSIFFPIRWYQSRAFKKAQKNAPKMKEVQDKLKELQKKGVPADDPRMREIQMEQLKLMKGSVPIAGCLPMLLQMPLFFALYTAVTIALDFRQASFLWLPDLSAGDPWHILDILFAASMAGTMIFTPQSPAITEEQKTQQKMMTYMMPGMMLLVLWGAPAGLLLYWVFGNLVSFGQQFIINRLNKNADDTQETPTIDAKKGKQKFSTT